MVEFRGFSINFRGPIPAISCMLNLEVPNIGLPRIMAMSKIGWDDRNARGVLPPIRVAGIVPTFLLALLAWSDVAWDSHVASADAGDRPVAALEWPVVMTQVAPVAARSADVRRSDDSLADRTFRKDWGDGARLLLVEPDGSVRRLAESFQSACDPEVSFDGKRILFAGRPTADASWGIYELRLDRSTIRHVLSIDGACRNPRYLSTLYTIVSDQPWYQILFVGRSDRSARRHGGSELYSCKLDGSELTRLTGTLSVTADPILMPDGRVLFASWQSTVPMMIDRGRFRLFAMNLDGTDYATYAGNQGLRIQQMPCLTTGGLLVCVESKDMAADGSGMLGSFLLRRPLHSYRPITTAGAGLFHSPAPLPDGTILVSWRSAGLGQGDSGRTHGVYRFDLATRTMVRIYDDPRFDEIQTQVICPRSEPDGRSSVVRRSDRHGELYCLDAYTSDQKFAPGSLRRVRVLQGMASAEPGPGGADGPPGIGRRILGEVPVESDGSFRVKVPANMPIQLQLLDAQGQTLRSCRWIWARNREPRGCIGCHEDGERTPENRFVEALKESSMLLESPADAAMESEDEKPGP
jgi:Tol biopolymer transport system component